MNSIRQFNHRSICKLLENQIPKRKVVQCKYTTTATSDINEHESSYTVFNNQPNEHTQEDVMKFYSIKNNEIKTKLTNVIPKKFKALSDALNETTMMIRKPAIEVIQSIEKETSTANIPRYIIYGPKGSGKSMTMLHIIHYCLLKDWIILHVPHGNKFADTKSRTQVIPSGWSDKRADHPEEATLWLNQFRAMNTNFLLDNKTSQQYNWGKREITEKDKPLLEVVEQGIGRSIYAADAVGVLLKEIQINSSLNVLYAVDGFNGFYGKTSYTLNNRIIDTENLSLVHHFTKLLNTSHTLHNGAYVMGISHTMPNLQKNINPMFIEEQIPEDVLQRIGDYKEILVGNYDHAEYKLMMNFYKTKHWIARDLTDQLMKEMKFMTDRNPELIRNFCASI